MRWLAVGVALLVGTCVSTLTAPAEAFTTRFHIVLANDVRQALIANGGAGVPLKFGNYTVVLSAEDVDAITNHPLEFRAGAVGPDNMAFPAMTDPSHAVGQRPFEQCQMLYEAAILPEEKAYAAGCFLHGATDAVAHHYVNFLTGETFTLNPISADRQFSWTNVVRHVTAESMVQAAAFKLNPQAFSGTQLSHTIPKSFVQRAYLSESSPLWQQMSLHARSKLATARAENPGQSLLTVIPRAGLAPADHLVLSPVYLREIEEQRKAVRAGIEQTISDLQNPVHPDGASLGVGAGSDGQLGTSDDTTSCSASCPTLYAKYRLYVALLAPRFDAQNNPLPSAFDKISDKLRDDLYGFLPAYLATVENLSNQLNLPPTADDDGLSIDKAQVAALFGPMTQWSNDITTIDFTTLTQALLPDWLISLENALNAVGVNVSIPNLIAALLDPVLAPIKDAIKTYVIDEASAYVEEFVDQYKQLFPTTRLEFEERLKAAAPAGHAGTFLDALFDSGLYGHSFNIAAVSIAEHEAVLPVGDHPVGIGPATFDASHVPSWMQVGVCDYLRDAVFPLGMDLAGSMSLFQNGSRRAAHVSEDSPVECHDGSLSEFASVPTPASCMLVSLDTLAADPAHRGSVSRAHPPALSDDPVSCIGLAIDGLPAPPPGLGGNGGAGGGIDSTDPNASSSDDAGCGCRVGARTPTAGSAWWLLAGLLLVLRRRRRTSRRSYWLVATGTLLFASGCGSDGGNSGPGSGGAAGFGAFGNGGVGGSAGAGGGSAGMGAAGSAGAGGSLAAELIDALGNSVWHALLDRDGKQRAYELSFDAPNLIWAEIRNPYGPARKRTLRILQVQPDGFTVDTTITVPSGWPTNPDNGKKESFGIEVLDGPPRQLRLTRGGVIETFDEGPWPAPADGLTAIVRVFAAGGTMAGAFCEKSTFSGPDRAVIFDFARGKSSEPILGEDIVAGAKLTRWTDPTGSNQFAVTDVPGFGDLGGTELSDQYNFIVLYTGSLTHSGGSVSLRENDDDVRDAIWGFLGPGVGSSSTNDVFLEVHGHAPADLTADAPSAIFPSQDLPIEAMVLRCDQSLQDIDFEVNQGTGFGLIGNADTKPRIDDTLFPPAL